jgi:high-affinity iron transporter
MLQAFIIVAREGLESFLIVGVLLAYLRKSGRANLAPAVFTGIGLSLLLAVLLVVFLTDIAGSPLLEGILGVVTAILVGSLVIHMMRVGSSFRKEMELKLARAAEKPTTVLAFIGVLLVTMFFVTREGAETALMLYQVKNGRFILGGTIGLAVAALISYMWVRFSHLINVKRFFQVTGVYLIVFMVQVAFGAFHELCEAGVVPNSDYWHALTEPYSPDGMYGKWFSFIFVLAMGVWVVWAALKDKKLKKAT